MRNHICDRSMMRKDVPVQMPPMLDHLRRDKFFRFISKFKQFKSKRCFPEKNCKPDGQRQKTSIKYGLFLAVGFIVYCATHADISLHV